MPSKEIYMCPLKFANPNFVNDDEWLCEGRGCAWFDGRMRTCSVFSVMVMAKVFARRDGDKDRDRDRDRNEDNDVEPVVES